MAHLKYGQDCEDLIACKRRCEKSGCIAQLKCLNLNFLKYTPSY